MDAPIKDVKTPAIHIIDQKRDDFESDYVSSEYRAYEFIIYMERKFKELKKELADVKNEFEAYRTGFDRLNRENNQLVDERDAMESEALKYKMKLADVKIERNRAKNEAREYLDSNEETVEELNKIREELAVCKDKLLKSEMHNAILDNEREATENER